MYEFILSGHHIEEYRERFALSGVEQQSKILVIDTGATLSSHLKADETLPYSNFSFDLALCADYLFLDAKDEDIAFHLQVIRELARVAKEVRVFPLIDRDGTPSPALGPVLLGLQQANYGVEVRQIRLPAHAHDNAMLRVWALQCSME